MMVLENLTALVPPPDKTYRTSGDWSIAEQSLGITFPTDFKQLIERYGTGSFYGSLMVTNPLSPYGRDNLQQTLTTWQDMNEACEFGLTLHPARPGLLPWGSDSNGHLYCWWTDGEPDQWGIVQLFHGYEDDPLEIVPGPISEFLVRFLKNEYSNMLGGDEFTAEQYYFTPGIAWMSEEENSQA